MIELCCEYLSVWCGFTLKRIRDMIRTYSQMHRTDKYSQLASLAKWLSVWLSGCGFKSSCSHQNNSQENIHVKM